jgi:hypothetical protein
MVLRAPFAVGQAGAEVGIRLRATATATGGSGTYTWSLTSGSLPAGVALGSTNGSISGIPRVAGRFAFALTATDAEGRTASVNASLAVASRLMIRSLRVKAATRGQPYQATLATTGGVEPVIWKILRGRLPLGVRFAKKTGTLVGTPRRIGAYRVTVEARDALGAKVQTRLVLLVKT